MSTIHSAIVSIANTVQSLPRKASRNVIALVVILATALAGGIAYNHSFSTAHAGNKNLSLQSNSTIAVSRNFDRAALKNNGTTSIKVVIDGVETYVLGTHFTTVKSVLQAGDITLDPTDTITPKLTDTVNESTVINIRHANSTVEHQQQELPFNTIVEKTDTLPAGQKKVKTEGANGTIELTSIVQRSGKSVISSNVLTTVITKQPQNKIVLEGTGKAHQHSEAGNAKGAAAPVLGTTTPVGEAQSIAHDMLLSRGWSEEEFSCLVVLWQHESGWRTDAHNPSGAHGIPQALPGSKMGPGWESDPRVQISWGLNYISGRYGTPCGALNIWKTRGWY